MNNKIKIFGIALVAMLGIAVLGAGVAFAQTSTPNSGFGWMIGGDTQTGYGPGMMGGYAQNSDGWEWMSAMHTWMTDTGGMHTFVWNALAGQLDLTSDVLYAEMNSGKTIAQIAEEKGVSRTDLIAAMETAHQESLAQAVLDGYLTQEQADNILVQMTGRYEWMIDNAGAGYGMRGGHGGIMGGYYGQQGGTGQFTPGGCHGNFAPSASQNKP